MLKRILVPTALFFPFLLLGCDSNNNTSQSEDQIPATKTYVIFSPATGEMPVPNDLMFGPDGTLSAGDDSSNPVISGIDNLDGNSVVSPIDIQFSAPLSDTQVIDAASFILVEGNVIPNPNQNVYLLPLSYPGGDALLQASVDGEGVETPTFIDAVSYQSAVAAGDIATLTALATPTARAELLSLDGMENNTIRISPLRTLLPETKYLVIITDLEDYAGNPVYPSIAYSYIRSDDANFSEDLPLQPVQGAIQGWEQLAEGYFAFQQAVFDAAELPLPKKTVDNIVLSYSFTTGSTNAVLTSLAAPEVYFEKQLRTGYKQDAIAKLLGGSYNLSGDNSGQTSITDGAINSTINVLLSSPLLPDESPNPLYVEQIASAISAGADYATLAEDGVAAHIMQRAAAEAAISVHDSGSAAQGDKEPYIDIRTEAVGTVSALAVGASLPVSELFPVPVARAASFYRADLASDINPALAAPALIYQGQISLPVYQQPPEEMDGSNITTSTWQADERIGFTLDAGLGNDLGTTPPSEKTSARYPFPAKQADVTVPLLSVMPEPTTLSAFGISKPAEGWPVIIFQHGISAERSIILPIANALAFACIAADLSGPSGLPCFASIAIDGPLHGIEPAGSLVPGLYSVTDPDAPITPNLPSSPSAELTERHYDFTANEVLAAIPMDYSADFGSSGSLLINLSNFANNRDSRRQMTLDLLNLNASLATLDVDGDGLANDLDISKVYLIGHSLGAIDSINFSAINNQAQVQNSPFSAQPKIHAVSSIFPGGGIPRLLTNSPTFGPVILPALASASDELVQGKSGLEAYLSVFQGAMDSADPLTLASGLRDTGLLVSEIKGSPDGSIPPDTLIVNGADTIWGDSSAPLQTVLENGFVIDNFPAPLSGTEPLAAELGLVKTAEASASTAPARLITRYIEGSHRTPISAGNTAADPDSSAAVFFELVTQSATFFALNGAVAGSIVTNSEVVEP
ncbi:hypothetical protein SAMN02745866_02252 [Alteromonadaceae bacterium Bs31]|nr:hypothetical protein SAMN02745866_02252 [Alteromonadaceae bacterium Bs31]